MIKSRINGKTLFGMGVMFALFTAVLFWQANIQEGQAQSVGGFNHAIVTARMDNSISLSSLASAASGENATLTAGGVLFSDVNLTHDPDDDQEVGRIRIWGTRKTDTVFSDLANGSPVSVAIAHVNISIELPGFNGTLQAQGALSDVVNDGLHGKTVISSGGVLTFNGDDVVAITGGTGTFRGANGEATIQNNDDGTFTIRLQEAKRR